MSRDRISGPGPGTGDQEPESRRRHPSGTARRPDRPSASATRRPVIGAVPLFVAGATASVLSLASTVIVARMLPSVGYGELAKLLGVFLLLSMPATALMVGVVRRVASWEACGLQDRVRNWIVRVHRVALLSVTAIIVTAWFARGQLAHAMRLNGSAALVFVVCAGGVFILVTLDRGFLQARRGYPILSANVAIEAGVRTVGMIGLTAMGLGVAGAAFGILAGELAAVVHARWYLLRSSAAPAPQPVEPRQPAKVVPLVHRGRDLAADVTMAVVCMVMLAILQNGDVVIFGSRAPEHSGLYAAISVPAKALVFWAVLFANYLIPETTIRFAQGANALRQLGHTLGLVVLPATVLCAIALIAPRTLLTTVFGSRYASAASGLAPLVMAMVFLGITVVLTIYLLGTGFRLVVVPLLIGTGALLAACWSAGGHLLATTQADLAVQAGLALTMAAIVALHHRVGVRSGRVTPALELLPAGSTTGSA